MTTEQKIREAAASGRLVGLTLWRTADGGWQASISPDRVSWSVSIDTDPVEAIRRALGVSTPAVSVLPQDMDIFG